MKLLAAATLLAINAPAGAGSIERANSRSFYVGEARVTDIATGVVRVEPIALERRIKDNLITETACTPRNGRRAALSTMYITQTGAALAVTNRQTGVGSVRGTGAISPRWNGAGADYIHLTMTFELPAGQSLRIEDDNYMPGGKLIARKVVLSGTRPVQLWEAELPETSASVYRAEVMRIGCH